MNHKQKLVIIISGAVVLLSVLIWLYYGGEIFTKYQVLVEVQSELDKQLGISQQEWRDKFIWGLDYTLIVSGIAIVFGGIMTYLFKNKKQTI